MKFFDVVNQRHSVRNFLQTPLTEDSLRRILEAANAAPSAGNFQSYEIFAVTGKRARQDLARAAHEQLFIAGAPVSLVFCANPSRSAERYGARAQTLYSVQDATIACSFAMLAAAAQGIGSVWIGSFDPEQVRTVIGAPADLEPVAILPLGQSAARPEPAYRRDLEDLVHPVE